MTDDDWRLHGQESYLAGVALRRREYRRYSETWDHDHCSFCWSKFAERDHIPDALHCGFATLDDYHWICQECFDDFKERFGWRVAE